jgi:hypothetical protein
LNEDKHQGTKNTNHEVYKLRGLCVFVFDLFSGFVERHGVGSGAAAGAAGFAGQFNLYDPAFAFQHLKHRVQGARFNAERKAYLLNGECAALIEQSDDIDKHDL